MDIDLFIEKYSKEDIVTETEVRTKFAHDFFRLLDYPDIYRAEEFPIFANNGREKLKPKSTDIIFFDDKEFNKHRKREDVRWVYEHSLLVIELKKPAEKNDAEGQAQFYSFWAKVKYYIITNGIEISFYIMKEYTKDELFLNCKVKELPIHWTNLYSVFNYNELSKEYSIFKGKSNPKKDHYYHYCLSFLENTSNERKNVLNQEIQEESSDKENLNPKLNIINTLSQLDDNTIIVGDAGIGKSFNLKELAIQIASQRISDDTTKIPILLKGNLWGKVYNNIVEAIQYEIEPFIPHISKLEIQKNIKDLSYSIIIDALDEVTTKKEELLSEIDRITKIDNHIIISSRAHVFDSLYLGNFKKYNILPLSDENVDLYLNTEVNKNLRSVTTNFDQSLTELIHYPLFLIMLVELIKENPEFKIPSNKALLYKRYTKRILSKVIDSINNNISISLIERLLGEIAYKMDEDILEHRELSSIIEKESTPTISGEIEKLIFKSELISIHDSIVNFYHPSFQEYFIGTEVLANRHPKMSHSVIVYSISK